MGKNVKEEALKLHKENQGKIALKPKISVDRPEDLVLAYTPGVAEPCLEISKDGDKVYDYTSKGNWVAIVTNGTAVLGLGDIGAAAGLPVMEGKAILFKEFAGVDAFPICLDTKDVDEIVNTVKLLETSFGGINLEDIKAPECIEIEEKLKKICNIPVFHDDQHGTAIVVAASLINGLKVVEKKFNEIKVVINGAGAAGLAIAKLLFELGVEDIILCDSNGPIYEGRKIGMNKYKEEIAKLTNKSSIKGSLGDALVEADVFIGVSVPNCINKEMIKSMNREPIIMALANPEPEILPDVAKEAGAKVVCTGRSDFPNQVNNLLAFPGVFKGAFDVKASEINEEMKIAASYAIAELVDEDELGPEFIIPNVFDPRVSEKVASAVSQAAIKTGVARK
ncbi:NAD(P)-dependent malic enzyme [Clostridium sp. Cult2]|uniref:NAD(P)-dependent malic enzyme n=1 Tax=Clostridium sp. Cult2 TaxID=2079003 RepID=UPI001F15B9C1|nr:malic enzyme-like NAD(P)-binding protein [Clostridium sp. Cult2]MCF6466715.1 NAD-dependent malic enzyme [Clostridium sp. Cult2]